jgi:cystathionine beta-lyase
MSEKVWLNRRTFLKSAGTAAIAGAATSGASLLHPMASLAAPAQDGSGGFDFDTPYDRIGTDCAKWDTIIERHGAENIQVAMGVADMDFKCAPAITEALAERVRHENWGYLKMPDDFFPAIVDWNKNRHGLEINPDLMALSDGVHPALIAALKAFARPGSKVLLTTSTYSGFYTDLRESHTLAEESPLIIDNGVHRLDFDDLESRISQETDALILCNPQNPTGNCWSPEDLMRLGQLCLERRVVVLADEIHCDFVTRGQKYTPFASLPDQDVVNNSVTFQSGSKTFSLAAMKVAWFHSPNAEYFEKVQEQHMAQTNTLGVVAQHAALRGGAEWLDQLLAYLDGNHDYVEQHLRDNVPQIRYNKAQGTYLAWLDVSQVAEAIGAADKAAAASETEEEPVTPEDIVVRWLVENAGVYTNPGSNYGPGGEGWVRMNLGTSRQLIKLALDNIAEAMHSL